MGFKAILCTGLLAFTMEVSADRLHLATKGLLQVPPSFVGKGISLFPGHHPDHDVDDLGHLVPQTERELYYTQEGHRPAIHGAKHGNVKATFLQPTVVLDHSSHLRELECTPGQLKACFASPEAFQTVQRSWNLTDFNLATYHVGCGDQVSGKRTFFHATNPVFDIQASCARVAVAPLDDEDALDSGEVSWGTYKDPKLNKRFPVKGHVRLDPAGDAVNATADFPWPWDPAYVDLTKDAAALRNYFEDPDLDTSDMHELVDDEDTLDFLDEDELEEAEQQQHRRLTRRSFWGDAGEFFKGIWRGITGFFDSIGDFFKRSIKTIQAIAAFMIERAIISAKLLAVPFGVPFDHSYHHDVKMDFHLEGEVSNRPPQVFGFTDGFNLASSGSIYTVQCAKCGVRGEFTIEGRLAFDLKNGLKEGILTVTNQETFVIDAQFGITAEAQHDTTVNEVSHQLGAFPLSPLAIPGIITIGPELTVGTALDMVLTGKASLLVGGTLKVAPGSVQLSIKSKEENKVNGLSVAFEPAFKLEGSLTAAIELGLPVGFEVGLDLLNGKWKKSVGYFHKPSIYATATISSGEGHKCDNGVELRAGIKDRLYFAALDKWDYDVLTLTLYEKGIGCVTKDGFDANAVEDDASVIADVISKRNGDTTLELPKPRDVAQTMKSDRGKTGYRIIMDVEGDSILVSGKDGHLYMVGTSENYDYSAPWGTIDVKSPAANLDVFGRMISVVYDDDHGYAASLTAYEPDRVPKQQRAAALTDLRPGGKKEYPYGISLTRSGQIEVYYPTVCKTSSGLRLYATKYMIDKSGKIVIPKGLRQNLRSARLSRGLSRLGVDYKKCRTIRLGSS